MAADLHIHTVFSDGDLTPEEIVKLTQTSPVNIIAITDHDILEGIEPAIQAAKDKDIKIIPGIEFTTEKNNREIHMLGYYIDYKNDELINILKKLQKNRYLRLDKMIAQLKAVGLEVSRDRVVEIAGNGSVGRPHLAQVLIEQKYVSSIKEAFIRYLIPGKPGYCPHYKLLPEEAIDMIKKAGGVSVFAHPKISNSDEIIPELVAKGLSGIEVFYPSHSAKDEMHYSNIAHKYNLVLTGGSDFHGSRGVNEVTIGYKFIPDKYIDQLEKRRP